jgi:hypothetical protein
VASELTGNVSSSRSDSAGSALTFPLDFDRRVFLEVGAGLADWHQSASGAKVMNRAYQSASASYSEARRHTGPVF